MYRALQHFPTPSDSRHLASFLSQKQREGSPQKEGRGRGVRGDEQRGFQPTTPKAGREGLRAGTNLLKKGWQELKGGRSGGSAPAGGSRPALGEWGQQEGGRGERARIRQRTLGWVGGGTGPPPPAQLQRGAAETTPGRIFRTVKRRAGPCQCRPGSPTSLTSRRAPENIPSLLPTVHPPPRQGPLRPDGGTRQRR